MQFKSQWDVHTSERDLLESDLPYGEDTVQDRFPYSPARKQENGCSPFGKPCGIVL